MAGAISFLSVFSVSRVSSGACNAFKELVEFFLGVSDSLSLDLLDSVRSALDCLKDLLALSSGNLVGSFNLVRNLDKAIS